MQERLKAQRLAELLSHAHAGRWSCAGAEPGVEGQVPNPYPMRAGRRGCANMELQKLGMCARSNPQVVCVGKKGISYFLITQPPLMRAGRRRSATRSCKSWAWA